MSDIQQYTFFEGDAQDPEKLRAEHGSAAFLYVDEFVRAADHVAALAAQATAHEAALAEAVEAEQVRQLVIQREWGDICRQVGREYEHKRLTNHDMHSGLACLTNYEQGVSDERARIRAGVEALVRFDHNGYALVVYPDGDFLDRVAVLAVIDPQETA